MDILNIIYFFNFKLLISFRTNKMRHIICKIATPVIKTNNSKSPPLMIKYCPNNKLDIIRAVNKLVIGAIFLRVKIGATAEQKIADKDEK